MKSREYWERVALLREQYAQEQADQIILQINRLYSQVQQDILAEVEMIFSYFSDLTGLSGEEAREYISKAQQDVGVSELRRMLTQTDDLLQRTDLTNRINAQAYGARLTRLEAAQEAAYRAIKKVAMEEQKQLGSMLEDIYTDGYYQSIHDIGKGANIGIDFAVVSDLQIKQAIERPWQGATFSERVWHNTDTLAAKAGQVILRGVATGADVYTLAKQLQPLANSGKYAAVRLVRTETNHIYNQAQLDAYDSAGIEQYQFLATLDYRTCEVCQPLDGKVFNRSEAMGGINYPTMHPNCRCTTTVPMAYASRWANDGVHKYKTDGNVTYSQWSEQMSPKQRAAFDRHVKQWKRGLQTAKKSGIMTTQEGKMMNILPNLEKIIIPREKFTAYALNPEKDLNKARAFEQALGYNRSNVDKLIDNIYRNIKNFEAVKKLDNGYGQRYSVLMSLVGENEKRANVQTAWIIDKGTGAPRLVSAYVTNKKIKE